MTAAHTKALDAFVCAGKKKEDEQDEDEDQRPTEVPVR
jgi:hypothetical protein